MRSRVGRPGHVIRFVVATLVVLVGFASFVQAQGHRARLSADLSEHLSQQVQAAVDVIVTGDANRIGALAARYGIAPKRILRAGAVFRLDAWQLDADEPGSGNRPPVR